LEAVDGWTVEDENMLDTESQKESIFSESAALMQPQDMRQYAYSMSPTSTSNFPVVHAPGSIIPLGRLDISWRSSFGEPGRLLTSVRRFMSCTTIPSPDLFL
jgi:trafficking protein particle complex subunit 13